MQERHTVARPVPLSLIPFKKYTDFYSIRIMTEYALYYCHWNIRETDAARGMMKVDTLYFSRSSHCKVSSTRCLPKQYARSPLQFKYKGKGKGKGRGKVLPRTGHEGPEGVKGKAIPLQA